MIGTTATSRGIMEVCAMVGHDSSIMYRAVQALASGIGCAELKVKDGKM